MGQDTTRTIQVDTLARVEGEGALDIRIRQGRVEAVKFRIFEPPRFFEALLRGRDFTEAPDITARICGICPVAYLMSACHAMEAICGVTVDGELRALRRLLYCGEWIESHVLHMTMLHLPDFLGYEDVIQLAADNRPMVDRALRIKKIGNQLMRVVGGREIHPVNIRVGGFYRVPTQDQLNGLLTDLRWGLEAAETLLAFLATLPFPEFEKDYHFVALRHPGEYPFNEGELVSSDGESMPISAYESLLTEQHVAHSTALHSVMSDDRLAHVGPLARYAINGAMLTPRARAAADRLDLGDVCRNPFKSILVRGVEVIFAFEEAIRIIEAYRPPAHAHVAVHPRAGEGQGCTEAPRGICYHRYRLDEAGIIRDAKIVAPTSVNQKVIEQDLYDFVEPNIHLPDEELKLRCEQAIRNYDPCISCSTHFLTLNVDRA